MVSAWYVMNVGRLSTGFPDNGWPHQHCRKGDSGIAAGGELGGEPLVR